MSTLPQALKGNHVPFHEVSPEHESHSCIQGPVIRIESQV